MRYFIMIFAIILVGCGDVDKSELKKLNGIETKKEPITIKKNPFEVKKDKPKEAVKIEKEIKTSKDIVEKAKIEQENSSKKMDFELKKDRLKSEENLKKESMKNKLELKKLEQKQQLLEVEKKYETYKIALISLAVFLFFALVIFYFLRRKKHEKELDVEKEKFHREKDVELYKLQTERFEKIVEVVTKKDLSKESEQMLIEVLHKEAKDEVIEVEPKKKGLFYKK